MAKAKSSHPAPGDDVAGLRRIAGRKGSGKLPAQMDFGDHRFRTFAEIAEGFGLGCNAITILAQEKDFPVFARKVSPALMAQWLSRNSDRLRRFKIE